ncbi:MAG: DNA polymerase I [Acidobacteriota bacterium]|nr:DNA polymerase I [Acidobacteriota bacterium]MDQ2978369.1 DNA polymerase I [Acidobacteriota bacterium]
MPPRTLYLVDAMSNIHRAYHAIQRLSTSAGRPTNAIYGFVTMLRKMLREHAPDLCAVAWDGPERTQRHDAYAAYKANRPAMADDLSSQLPDIRLLLQAYEIPILELPGFEADDVIGTLAAKAAAGGYDVVIVTADKDMLQLVGPRVRVFHTGKEAFLDEAGVESFFGVKPGQVADVLALMGDSVDNVPGVPGVGQVTAKKWILQYGSLPALLEKADEIKGKVGDSLRQNREAALLSRRLVEIPVDLPIPFDPEALRRSPPDFGRLKELFVRLEFHSLAAEIQGDSATSPEISSRRLTSGERFTIGGKRAGVALLNRGERALLALSDGRSAEIAEEDARAVAALWSQIDRPGASFGMADAKPLDALLARAGRSVEGDVFDICLAQYVLSSGVASPELEPMAFQRLGQKLLSDKEAGVTSCALPEGYEIANADRWLAERAAAAAVLSEPLSEELAARPTLERIYREIERPLTPVLARMENAGVAVDVPLLREISARMEKELRALEQRIWQEAGEEFNVNSPVKLGQILFEKLGYPVLKKTAKTKTSSTGVEVLTELAERGLPLPKLVLEFREISKLKGTYVDALPALADAEGRVHSSFRQTVASTGRLSSSDPNLQNIPIRTEAGREIRKAFVAPPGGKLVVADYSQIELRILAHLSGDEALIRAFEQEEDIHCATAAKIFGVSADLVSKEMRFAAKRINFALLYGMAPFTLGKELGVSTSEAKSYVDSYFAQFPRVRACLDGILGEARRTREVTTMFGRVRPIPEIAASNPNVRGNAERMALNAPFQGAAADIIKIAMIRLDRALIEKGLASRLVLQVHDELVLESPDGEVEPLTALLREIMEGAASLRVRLAVEVGAGRDWLSAK